jgi:hypothetical protein
MFYMYRKLKNEIAEKDRLINSYVADVKRLTREQDEKIVADCHAAEFVVDWDKMNAFSIERHGGEKEAYTIIGHYDKDGNIAEWKFYCSLEQHNKLAKEYASGITKKVDIALREYSTST